MEVLITPRPAWSLSPIAIRCDDGGDLDGDDDDVDNDHGKCFCDFKKIVSASWPKRPLCQRLVISLFEMAGWIIQSEAEFIYLYLFLWY